MQRCLARDDTWNANLFGDCALLWGLLLVLVLLMVLVFPLVFRLFVFLVRWELLKVIILEAPVGHRRLWAFRPNDVEGQSADLQGPKQGRDPRICFLFGNSAEENLQLPFIEWVRIFPEDFGIIASGKSQMAHPLLKCVQAGLAAEVVVQSSQGIDQLTFAAAAGACRGL